MTEIVYRDGFVDEDGESCAVSVNDEPVFGAYVYTSRDMGPGWRWHFETYVGLEDSPVVYPTRDEAIWVMLASMENAWSDLDQEVPHGSIVG